MAKFCANCGAEMADTDRVCGQCGTPAPVESVPVAPIGEEVTADSKNNKIIVLVAAAIVAVVALVVIVNIVSNFTGKKGVIRKMCNAIVKEDIDALDAIDSSISEEIYEASYGDDYLDVYEKRVENTLDTFEDKVGEIKSVKFEIVDETEYSDRKMEDIKEELEDDFNMDTSDIKKIVETKVKLTVKGKKKSASYTVDDLYLVKEKGGWKIFYGSALD